jgi:hypothetical protein
MIAQFKVVEHLSHDAYFLLLRGGGGDGKHKNRKM